MEKNATRLNNRGGYKRLKVYSICITIILVTCILLFSVVCHHAGYDVRFLEKFGILEPPQVVNWTAKAWEWSLSKMNHDADIVFLGDSITAGSDFQAVFPEYSIVELGVPGDTITGMISRTGMVKAVSPEKVFVMAGINSLTDSNSDEVLTQYKELIASLKEIIPDAEIFIQSILPISIEKEVSVCHNRSIMLFNENLRAACDDFQVTYIDLFSLYEKDGYINPDLTKDGIHLQSEAYSIWAEEIREYIEKR